MLVRLVAGIAAAVYLAQLLAVPFLDSGRDVLRAYPEDYATGLAVHSFGLATLPSR